MRHRPWREELTETLRLASPMALTQLGQIAMMTTDLALIGRLGDEAVAAVALAHTVLFAAFVVGMGPVSAVAPLAAQAFGARAPRQLRRSLRVGVWAALMLGVPLTLLPLWAEPMLVALGQAPEPATLAGSYLAGLAWSLVPAWIFIAFRNFMSAVNRPEPALWITLMAIPANGGLAYALIHGEFGLPRLGIMGAGIATTIVDVLMCAAAIWVCHTQRPFRKYRVLGNFWRADWPLFGRLTRIGLPISGAFMLEFGLFAASTFMMGRIGTSALAAHQIALQVSSITFMVPFGIAMAATVRVGQAVGRRDRDGVRRAGFVAMGLGGMFMASMTALVVVTRDAIPGLFLGAAEHHAAETAALASLLLLLGAFFFVADGLQTVASGALRGLNDTRVPMLLAGVGFWGIGFTSAYGLAFPAALGAVGVWLGLTVGLVSFASLLILRFAWLTRRHELPDPPPAGA